MDQPSKRRGKLLKAALAVAAMGTFLGARAQAAPSSALEKAAAKRTEVAKERAEAATPAKAPEAPAASSSDEALKFDPFASAAPASAAATAEPSATESAKRLAARDAALTKMASIREGFLKVLGAARANRRSPNSPPPFTPRRPSDPPGPPDNVPPGPPQHAPPGRPPGVGNG